MKKLIAILAIFILTSVSISARDKYSRNESDLPKAALATINNNFKSKISLIKKESTIGIVKEYEVILNDGCEICFDRNGNWFDIETPWNMSVPSGFIPQSITDYIKKNHKNERIIGLERDNKNYTVELSNGIEIKFDIQGNFKKYDK